ncbi:hypothetical protein LTS18_006095, partial [Coniosporium uncinatum]
MSLGSGHSATAPPRVVDVPLEAYRELQDRQDEFFGFLEGELMKIETFYKQKEDEATGRLQILREQLHIMRDRRVEELLAAKNRRQHNGSRGANHEGEEMSPGDSGDERPVSRKGTWLGTIDGLLGVAKTGRLGKTSKAMEGLATPTAPNPIDSRRDYTRRPVHADVPYRTAKRKLKIALAEYYRGLELLKSYALLNRTAFRKINKKFDKTINAKPAGRFMTEKVNKAWFVQSNVIEEHIRAVEDLYARYFERGNHKVAAGKLRATGPSAGDYTGSVFRSGCLLTAGAVFGIQGLTYGAELLFSNDPVLALHTSYLMQLYAGYFLILFLMLLFCLVCKFWAISKINYPFIFEFDTRHHLDWRQLVEMPSFCWFLLGFFMWINFSRFGASIMYIYYPVILMGATVVFIFLPAPAIYHRSRAWFLYAN